MDKSYQTASYAASPMALLWKEEKNYLIYATIAHVAWKDLHLNKHDMI